MIGIISCLSGDVVKFCGDAVLIAWPSRHLLDTSEGHSQEWCHIVTRAIICALRLQRDCGSFSVHDYLPAAVPADNDIVLNVRCGIAAGDVYSACVGTPGRYEYILCGKPVVDVGLATAQPPPGGICLHSSAHALVLNHVYDSGDQVVFSFDPVHGSGPNEAQDNLFILRTNGWVDAVGPPDEPPLLQGGMHDLFAVSRTAQELVSSVLPPELWTGPKEKRRCILEQRISLFVHRSARDSWSMTRLGEGMGGHDTSVRTSELREVVTLFVAPLGFDDDMCRGHLVRVQEAVAQIMGAAQEAGARLRQVALDDKGLVVILNLGLVGCAHADAAARGVRLALAIRKVLTLGCKIGVSHGTAFCGYVGTCDRCEYTVMGSCVNVAARLMSKCNKGDILVDEFTYHLSRGSPGVTFARKTQVRAKGYPNPISVFSPTTETQTQLKTQSRSSDDDALSFDTFVGRTKELKVLEVALKECTRTNMPSKASQLKEEPRRRPAICSDDSDANTSDMESDDDSDDFEDSGDRVDHHRPRALLFLGPESVGKTRLVTEALRRARGADAPAHVLLAAPGAEAGDAAPYTALGEVLRQLLTWEVCCKGMGVSSGANAEPISAPVISGLTGRPAAKFRKAVHSVIAIQRVARGHDSGRSSSPVVSTSPRSRDGEATGDTIPGTLGGGINPCSPGGRGAVEDVRVLCERWLLAFWPSATMQVKGWGEGASCTSTDPGANGGRPAGISCLVDSTASSSGCSTRSSSSVTTSDDDEDEGEGFYGGLGLSASRASSSSGTSAAPLVLLSPLIRIVLGGEVQTSDPDLCMELHDVLKAVPSQAMHLAEKLAIQVLILALQTRGGTALVVEDLYRCDAASLRVFTAVVRSMRSGLFIGTSRRSSPARRRGSMLDTGIGEGGPTSSAGKRFSLSGAPAFARRRMSGVPLGPATALNDQTMSAAMGSASESFDPLAAQNSFSAKGRLSRADVRLQRLCEVHHVLVFGVAEAAAVLRAVLGRAAAETHAHLFDPNDGIITRGLDATQGLPFLVQTFALNVRHALEAGTYKGLDELPLGSHAIVVAAMDRQSSTAQLVLKAASVIGLSFTTTEVGVVLAGMNAHMAPSELASAIHSLCAGRLLAEESLLGVDASGRSQGVLYYSFVDMKVLTSAYRLMLSSHRRSAHLALAQYLEKHMLSDYEEGHGQDDPCEWQDLMEVTSQYSRTTNLERRVFFLQRTARAALNVGSTESLRAAWAAYDDLLVLSTGGTSHALALHCCPTKKLSVGADGASGTAGHHTDLFEAARRPSYAQPSGLASSLLAMERRRSSTGERRRSSVASRASSVGDLGGETTAQGVGTTQALVQLRWDDISRHASMSIDMLELTQRELKVALDAKQLAIWRLRGHVSGWLAELSSTLFRLGHLVEASNTALLAAYQLMSTPESTMLSSLVSNENGSDGGNKGKRASRGCMDTLVGAAASAMQLMQGRHQVYATHDDVGDWKSSTPEPVIRRQRSTRRKTFFGNLVRSDASVAATRKISVEMHVVYGRADVLAKVGAACHDALLLTVAMGGAAVSLQGTALMQLLNVLQSAWQTESDAHIDSVMAHKMLSRRLHRLTLPQPALAAPGAFEDMPSKDLHARLRALCYMADAEWQLRMGALTLSASGLCSDAFRLLQHAHPKEEILAWACLAAECTLCLLSGLYGEGCALQSQLTVDYTTTADSDASDPDSPAALLVHRWARDLEMLALALAVGHSASSTAPARCAAIFATLLPHESLGSAAVACFAITRTEVPRVFESKARNLIERACQGLSSASALTSTFMDGVLLFFAVYAASHRHGSSHYLGLRDLNQEEKEDEGGGLGGSERGALGRRATTFAALEALQIAAAGSLPGLAPLATVAAARVALSHGSVDSWPTHLALVERELTASRGSQMICAHDMLEETRIELEESIS